MRLSDHVEVLPDGHLGTHGLDDGQRPLEGESASPAPWHLDRPHHQQVAEQDCPGPAEGGRVAQPAGICVQGLELAVGGRLAAPNVGGVHHVVVYQRAGVQQLEAAGCGPDGLESVRLGDACRGDIAPGAEAGPDALTAASWDAIKWTGVSSGPIESSTPACSSKNPTIAADTASGTLVRAVRSKSGRRSPHAEPTEAPAISCPRVFTWRAGHRTPAGHGTRPSRSCSRTAAIRSTP